ncbi:MAG: hypothetical protein QTN59_17415 [Candidatus Electrothrix communis]|nr:MAG: hypothetical protein QTN59_17415 [Candidatus Electrothrix communis]
MAKKILAIRLHPDESVSAEKFQEYLTGLSITAYELSVDNPKKGTLLGTAKYEQTYNYKKKLLPLTLEHDVSVGLGGINSPSVGLFAAKSQLGLTTGERFEIIQPFEVSFVSETGPAPVTNLFSSTWTRKIPVSLATAVIEFEYPEKEFESIDIRLEISRGKAEIIHKQNYYNVSLSDLGDKSLSFEVISVPNGLSDKVIDPTEFQTLTPVALDLALPAPPPTEQQNATVTVPEDGIAPNFDELHEAVNAVLLKDDLGGEDAAAKITKLTLQESRHIAYEILWGKTDVPLPDPSLTTLERIYTTTDEDDDPKKFDKDERDRQKYEGDLISSYVRNNREAERLSNYIFSLSAAIWCEKQSTVANKAGLVFPVLPDEPDRRSKVILTGGKDDADNYKPLNPAFTVPAAYFYALTSSLPPQVKREQRFDMAKIASEEQNVAVFKQALEDGVIPEAPSDVKRFQAARRLQALGLAKDKGTPECELVDGSAVQALVTAWLYFTEPNIDNFWIAFSDEQKYLELVLRAVTQNHDPLIQAIRKDRGQWKAVENVASLKARTEMDWKNLFNTDTTLLPPFIDPGTDEERIQRFFKHLQSFFSAKTGHLDLVLCVIAGKHQLLIDKIKEASFGVKNANDLAAKKDADWKKLLEADPKILPEFTKPGTTKERINAFIRHLKKIFKVDNTGVPSLDPQKSKIEVPEFNPPSGDLAKAFEKYKSFGFEKWDNGVTIDATKKFADWLQCIQSVINLTKDLKKKDDLSKNISDLYRFSVIEALWARGFLKPENLEGLQRQDFKDALAGSVAYEHVDNIWENAQATEPNPGEGGEFKSVNPDGRLVNCIPPEHLSPLGPVTYLKELLEVPSKIASEEEVGEILGTLLASRRGPLGELRASKANLSVPLPMIDLVNEALEHIVTQIKYPSEDQPEETSLRVVYKTAENQVGGHLMTKKTSQEKVVPHDPALLLEALPEHSTPNTPADRQGEKGAWNKIKNDFSACNLPYHQPFDVVRTYLEQLGTSRYATMRRFRKKISEFVLDPNAQFVLPPDLDEPIPAPSNKPADFPSHLWRYPVRHELALEYLGITPEEDKMLYKPGLTKKELAALYGFTGESEEWLKEIVNLQVFLERTSLTYCELKKLEQSKFVKFEINDTEDNKLPECEPCCLVDFSLIFNAPLKDLKKVVIFIRLWQKLGDKPNTAYSFVDLKKIVNALELFKSNTTTINKNFIRQLAALQMLRDDFNLSMDILALWGHDTSKKDESVQHLLNQIQQYAQNSYGCCCRPPEFIKILKDNLAPLSRLAGFKVRDSLGDTEFPDYTWDARPTNTLRFAEILAKIYASDFQVGELLFLFTDDPQLQGDAPYPLQTNNEALDLPFGLPDDDAQHSLFALRKKLLDISVDEQVAAGWTWTRMGEVLRREFGLVDTDDKKDSGKNEIDPWRNFGNHFFPDILTAEGVPFKEDDIVYRTTLSGTSEKMWSTPLDGPFQYEAGELRTQIPLTDEAVLEKLSRIRKLNDHEIHAVQELYFMPRAELVFFSFLFENQLEAEQRLIQEPDSSRRWAWFQAAFELFYRRCHAIAEHLAAHLDAVTGDPKADGKDMAMLLLKHLLAGENRLNLEYEKIDKIPNAPWGPAPNGGAFAALLGLVGTGMWGEYKVKVNKEKDNDDNPEWKLRWREVRGGTETFGRPENAHNAPVPTIIPAMKFSLDDSQTHYAAVRNGFAMANDDGRSLGGAESFLFSWHGLLLIEQAGKYAFSAGAPTDPSELPDFEAICSSHRWRVTLQQGQKQWVLLSHDWPAEEAPSACCQPIMLEHGFYDLKIELERFPMQFDGPEDVVPQTTGFQLKYDGPDAENQWQVIPDDKLFIPKKDAPLGSELEFSSSEITTYLRNHYVSTVRDMRRTYQRVFKAMLFVDRFDLSTSPVADDGQSEIAYLLSKPERFVGQSYQKVGGKFEVHKAMFDFNFLPVLDEYCQPDGNVDRRANPYKQHAQAMFDWWERLFDYTVMRAATSRTPEKPVWLLFHEAAEGHADKPAHLLRHMGVDVRYNNLVLQYLIDPKDAYDVTSSDLEDERWAIRVWQADLWCRQLKSNFLCKDIREVKPYLWVSGTPEGEGVANLTKFYRDGCIENGEPRRYQEIKQLNDGLRERGRAALVAYLTHMNRVRVPWKVPEGTEPFAKTAQHLSELLLLDVEAGLSQKMSRIEEAVSAVQLFIDRARLGLEPGFVASADFIFAWERRFSSFRVWQACKRREIYRENWIEWDEAAKARQTEAYQFLESELRSSDLTLPPSEGLASHSSLSLLHEREPATLTTLDSHPQGLNLLGTPDRHARASWLNPVRNIRTPDSSATGENESGPSGVTIEVPEALDLESSETLASPDRSESKHPMWFQAAVRLGTKFLRIAAAGTPSASTAYVPQCELPESTSCCEVCGKAHPALIDEYYFWLEKAEVHEPKEQVAEWKKKEESGDSAQTDWHNPNKLPGLLHWEAKPTVHLHWCRMHNGEFQTPRKSVEGVQVKADTYKLQFDGRNNDSLEFSVTEGILPEGYPTSGIGFRYDLAVDAAVTLPEFPDGVTAPAPEKTKGGLPSFPYFAWHSPGAPLLPTDRFSSVMAVATHLAMHCRFEESLNWLKIIYDPLVRNNTWMDRSAGQDGHCCPPSEPVSDQRAKQRLAMMLFVETLLDWADALLRKNTAEAFQRARLLADTADKILGVAPATVDDTAEESDKVSELNPACAPLNPRLMCLYSKTQDRLEQIHSSINAQRITNDGPMPYWGDDRTRECWKQNKDICLEEAFQCRPASPYRFQVLIQKATELANEVKSLGGQLLAAYEKGDSEYLSQMRVLHERQLNELTLEIRKNQWRESDWQVQALEKTKEMAITRLQYNENLIANGLTGKESAYQTAMDVSLVSHAAGQVSEAISQAQSSSPDMWMGTAGPFPLFYNQPPLGSKLGGVFAAAARISNSLAAAAGTLSSLNLTKAGWKRREEEWQHQVDVITIELEQIERQILAADRRRDIALRELNNHRQLMRNTAEVHDFLRDKFTNHALYLWLQKETAALHHRMYELALHTAFQAESAFNYERGLTDKFIPKEIWDNLHEGLLSGERLALALRQMDKAYLDRNIREYELTKHFSLRQYFPAAFLQLKHTGYCEIELPEWLFDLDYPGQYFRRIKNVSVSIPCVAGPYSGIHCRLTLLDSTTRISPELPKPVHLCCDDESSNNGYPSLKEDKRLIKNYAATESIATSGGQNDTGMFELNFRDERYLPFEYCGAVSRWRIELPLENNRFDMESLSDFILHLNYTAREGGDNLRAAAREYARNILPDNGIRFLDVKRDLGGVPLNAAGSRGDALRVGLKISRMMFPYLTSNQGLAIKGLDILFEARDARPSTHRTLTFFAGQSIDRFDKIGRSRKNIHSIDCVGDAELPGFYHGVLELDLGEIGSDGQLDLGVVQFSDEVEGVDNIYLLIRYEVVTMSEQSGDSCCCGR